MIAQMTRCSGWTGTVGIGPRLTIVESPEKDQQLKRLTLTEARKFVLQHFGSSTTRQLSDEELIECFDDLA